MGSTTWRCGTGASRVVSSHCVQIARRLGVAARAAIPARAGEREQVLVCAVVAADAREAVLEDPTGEELVGHLPDDRTPRAVLAGKALVKALAKALVVDRLQAVHLI